VCVLVIGKRLGLVLEYRVLSAIAIGLIMIQGIARGMTSPLREMAAAASAMARGDHSRRVQATSNDEIGDLARAFNAMAADLADVDRQRRELVANVSHELRTPIGALQALLENLADGIAPPDPAALHTALAQTQRLGRLVEQLLDLSRLEAGAMPLERQPFGVRGLLEQAARECALAGDRGVRLVVAVEPADLEAIGDPDRMHQVVANLVDNAVRHSPRAGHVWLAARTDNGSTAIEVADEGPGVAPEDIDRIFDRFIQTQPPGGGDGGTGLGLAIARSIVDAHGGTIRAEHRAPHGCRMIVELPR
jgi:signal transduction histidine kinase